MKRVKAENLRIEYEQDNPKKFGTMSWERYERYKKANTVAEMIDLGGKVADVAFDYSRGYIYVPDGGQFATFQLQTHKLNQVTPWSRTHTSSLERRMATRSAALSTEGRSNHQ